MKKSLFLLFISFVGLSINLFANDTYFYTSGGNLRPTNENDTTIRMKEEVIQITCENNYYQVTVDFEFENTGEEVTLSVGFPFFEAGLGGHGKIYDFECWTNDIKTDYKDCLIDQSFNNTNFNEPELVNAYVRDVYFKKQGITRTRVSYKSEYGRDTEGRIIKYLYGTGSTWKDTIGKITVIVENNLAYDSIFTANSKWTRIADNKWQNIYINVEPDYKDCFTFHTDDIFGDTGPKCFPAYFDFIKHKKQPESLAGYTTSQLRLIRNTIYALHGYNFKSKDLQELYGTWGRYWNPPYEINPNFNESDFSEIEKYNINLLFSEENARKKK